MTSTYPSSACVYIEKYLQLQHVVSIPEKISICLNSGHEESMDDYSPCEQRLHQFFFTVKVSV